MQPVGIDLGTGNSVIAVYGRGQATVLTVEGDSVMPSVVAARPDGALLVGRAAKRRALVDPEQTIVAIKREMGNRQYRATIAGKQYSPIEVSSLILGKLVSAASEQLGGPVKDAVISVPAYFTNNQKEDTRKAGEKAGLNVLRLIPEPTAAAVAYGLNQARNQTILVYDLGGGTFDVSILEVNGNNFTVKGIGGDHDLGGEDFDRRMIDLITTQLRNDPNLADQLAKADPQRMQQQLKESAEAAKMELSSAETTDIEIPGLLPGLPFLINVTRGQYERAIRDLVGRTIDTTLDAIKASGLTTDDIDRVVLVGGSTRVPMIQEAIAERIRDPFIADYVDEVVAHGAAIVAAGFSGIDSRDLAPVEIHNITAHSLGIRTAEDKFAVLISRGTSLPAEVSKTFTTARANADSTDVEVFQGDHELCANNQPLGGFQVTGIQRAAAGTPKIDVGFSIDEDDILTVTAADRSTGRAGELSIDKFEPKPYEPNRQDGKVDLASLRIGVSPSGCDDVGTILGRLGLAYKKLSNKDFRRKDKVAQFDVLFINCLCDITQVLGPGVFCNPAANKAALSEFVARGGVLYVSDYAYGHITECFPGRITFAGKKGSVGSAPVQVVDSEVCHLTGATTKVEFGPAYVVVERVSDACTVYMMRGSKEPVLVSFPHGEGYVVYTSFHNAAKISSDVAKVIMCVILRTVSLTTSTPLVELAEATNLSKM
jgi:molecular chaperone DnaK